MVLFGRSFCKVLITTPIFYFLYQGIEQKPISHEDVDVVNACNVTQNFVQTVHKDCHCVEDNNTHCQLDLEDFRVSCKPTANNNCRIAVAVWAGAFRNSDKVKDPKCFQEDPAYKVSQDADISCKTRGILSLSFQQVNNI